MLRDVLSAVVLVGTLWALWQLGHVRDALSQATDTPMQRKIQGADRVVHYRFDQDGGPSFHLDGDEVELRLVTHLFLEPGRLYSAFATYDYGLRLRIDDPEGNVLWERDIYTSTRQSKDEWSDGLWMQENAFGLDPGMEITDDRVHLITLPRDIPWGSTFHARLEAPAAEYGVIRAYERSLDSSLGVLLSYFGPAPDQESRLIGRLTYLPWDALSTEQRLTRLRLRWNRMSALGELGTDYEVETVFYTGFRMPPPQLPPRPPTELVDDRATAFTAWGPGELRLAIEADCPEHPGLGLDRPAIELLHLDAMGVVDGRHVDPCKGQSHEVWLPPGPHTMHVRGKALPPTTIEAWYDDHTQDPPELPGLELGHPFRPTITRSPRVRLHTGSVPASYALVEPEDLESAMIRLRARLPVPSRSGPEAQRPATIGYTFIDRHGEPLERGEWRVEPSPELAEYESVVSASDAERTWWVSPPKTTRFIAPEGTRRLELDAQGDAIVSVYAYWSGATEKPRPHPPYDEAMLVNTQWRRVPIDYQWWFPLSPHNVHILQRHNQTVDLHGPIRLELEGAFERESPRLARKPKASDIQEPGGGTSPWVSLSPYTPNERRTVLLKTSADSPWARYARWRPGAATLSVDDDWGAAAVYLVEGDPELALGQVLTATVDGVPVEHTILSTRGVWKLPGLGRGEHDVELGPLPPGVRVYLDRPGLDPRRGSTDVFRVITLYRLEDDPMGLKVDKTGDDGEYINALMIRCDDREPSQLSVLLDNGSPRRRRGVPIQRVTRAVRERELPARGPSTELVFFDRPQARCEALGRVPIPLGADLALGPHRVTLRMKDGPGVWVRFFRRGVDDSQDLRAFEWTERLLDLGDTAGAP
ncbi:MAG: hypothetical protein AAF799_37270 [Myxococcota bacterium]